MKKMNVLPMAALACITLLAGCGSGQTDFAESEAASVKEAVESHVEIVEDTTSSEVDVFTLSENEAEEVVDDALPLSLTSHDETITVSVPETWSDLAEALGEDEAVAQDFPLVAGNMNVPAYLIANRESKTETSLASFEVYTSTLVSGVTSSERFANLSITEETEEFEMKNTALKATRTVFTALDANNGNPTDIMYWIYSVEGEQGYYQFNCWTTLEQAETEAPIFDAIVSSMEENGGEAS